MMMNLREGQCGAVVERARRGRRETGYGPCHLQGALLELELALAGAPVAGAVGVVRVCLAGLGLGECGGAFLATGGHEGAVGVEDGEVALELISGT